MQVNRIDHLILTVKDISTTTAFYTSVLGVEKIVFGDERIALSFGNQKINLHPLGSELEPKAHKVQTGSADLCFIISQPIEQAIEHLATCNVPIIEGPVDRTGATGKIVSVYFRGPDGKLKRILIKNNAKKRNHDG